MYVSVREQIVEKKGIGKDLEKVYDLTKMEK